MRIQKYAIAVMGSVAVILLLVLTGQLIRLSAIKKQYNEDSQSLEYLESHLVELDQNWEELQQKLQEYSSEEAAFWKENAQAESLLDVLQELEKQQESIIAAMDQAEERVSELQAELEAAVAGGILPELPTAPPVDVTEEAPSESSEVPVTPSKSDNANLSALAVSPGRLQEFFSTKRTEYTAQPLPNDVTVLVIGLETSDPNATFQIEGNANLQVGENTIVITVTASDGITTKVYTITVEREAAPGTPSEQPASPAPENPPAAPEPEVPQETTEEQQPEPEVPQETAGEQPAEPEPEVPVEP